MNNQNNQPAKQDLTLQPIKKYFESEAIQKAFEKMLGDKASSFITSVLQSVADNKLLASADPKTVFMAAATSAALDLPINKNLGFAYIIPYKNNGQYEAQFQMGYRGYIQLAQRSGLMRNINTCVVYEGDDERDIFNRLTMLMPPVPKSNIIIGFVARFELLNGFNAHYSMRDYEVKAHALEFSQSYRSAEAKGGEWKKKTSPWHQHYETMAKKTVLKALISKQAPLSIDSMLNKALQADQAVIRDVNGDLHYDYVDNQDNEDYQDAPKLNGQQINVSNNDTLFQKIMSGVISGSIDKRDLLDDKAAYLLSDEQKAKVVPL